MTEPQFQPINRGAITNTENKDIRELQRRDGKIRNINEVIGELIASWKEYSKVSEKAAGKLP